MQATPFPVENVPFGVISTTNNPNPRPATIIEDTVIDLVALESLRAFDDVIDYPKPERPFGVSSTLNAFAALPKAVRISARKKIQDIWRDDTQRQKYQDAFIPARDVRNHIPMETVNYTDFVSSRGHCENIQNMLNTPKARRAVFYQMPTGYYGNSRNIVVSGTPVYRFHGLINGQFQDERPATTGPSQQFDYELELGVYLAGKSEYGKPIKLQDVDEHVFGFVLLNDWSARDIQSAESGGPTGPFLGKSGCVTVSPWIITLEALETSRLPRQHQPFVPFTQHLSEDDPSDQPCLDIRCSVLWSGSKKDVQPMKVSRAEYRETYWTYRQLIAHQTRNGSVIGTGDLIGTGTMSMFGGDDSGRCCLFERSYNGSKQLDIGGGQLRSWLEDGDEIVLTGWVHDSRTGEPMFGFGECSGVVTPSE